MKKKYRVPSTAITERGLKRLIKDDIKDTASSLNDWAKGNNITPQAVSAFLRNTQSAGHQIPAVFGLRPQVIYLPMDEEPINHTNPSRIKKKKRKS